MLIGAFEIKIGRITQVVTATQYGLVTDTGVKPDIEGVVNLVVLIGFITEQVPRIEIVPGIHSIALNQQSNLFNQCRCIGVQLAAFSVNKQGNRHTPGTLARDTPVGAVLEHGLHARLPPLGEPLYFFDFGLGGIEQAVLRHADKPLGRGAENQRRFGAPAVREAVGDFAVGQQVLALAEQLDNFLIDLVNVLTREQLNGGAINTIIVQSIQRTDAVFARHDKVINTVVGGCVHGTRARFGGDMITEQYRHLSIVKRML